MAPHCILAEWTDRHEPTLDQDTGLPRAISFLCQGVDLADHPYFSFEAQALDHHIRQEMDVLFVD